METKAIRPQVTREGFMVDTIKARIEHDGTVIASLKYKVGTEVHVMMLRKGGRCECSCGDQALMWAYPEIVKRCRKIARECIDGDLLERDLYPLLRAQLTVFHSHISRCLTFANVEYYQSIRKEGM